jgi:transcriptional regulator with XRE-family HTH domain
MVEPREPTWRAKWLGQKLRELRKNRGFSIGDVADRLKCGTSTINRFENGIYPVRPEEMVLLLTMFGVSERDQRDELMDLAAEVAERGWLESLVSDRSFADFLWAEGKAVVIRTFQMAVIPGLIQDPAYAEALIRVGPAADDEAMRLLEARVARGKILRGDNAPDSRFLLHEAVIHQRVRGIGDATYRAQLQHMLKLTEHPLVRIRILPLDSGAHNVAGLNTGITILNMPDTWPTLVHVETPLGAMVAETPDIDSFTDTYDALWDESALNEERTLAKLAATLKELGS